MRTIINDAIQVRIIPIDAEGTKEERIYFSLRSNNRQIGTFYLPVPAGIKELRKKHYNGF